MLNNLLKNKEKIKENTVLKNQKSYKKTREKSRGRSMVEMLGVLAIIGVLSIGGIAGYTIAMRKYRANEIINLANKYAVIAYTSFQNQLLNSDSEFELSDGPIANAPGVDLVYVYKDTQSEVKKGKDPTSLGAWPTGLTHLSVYYFYQTDLKESSEIDYDNLHNAVMIAFDFDDVELCKTVHSMLNLNGSDVRDLDMETIHSCDFMSGFLMD